MPKEIRIPSGQGIDIFLAKEKLSREEWTQFWNSILSIWRRPNLKLSQIAVDYYFHTLLLLNEAKPGEQRNAVVHRYADLLDAYSARTIPFIAARMTVPGQWNDIWQTFVHASNIASQESGGRFTREEHLAEISEVEANAQKRIWAINTVYSFIEDSMNDPKAGGIRNKRVEIGALAAIGYLVGIFEQHATGDQMLNNEEVQRYHFKKRNELSCFVLLSYLLSTNSHRLKFSAEIKDYQEIIVKGLKYIEKNFPRGFDSQKIEEKYPLIFLWLRERLHIVGQNVLGEGEKVPKLKRRS